MSDAPPGFPPPVKATIEWLQRRFAQWYADNPPPLPDRHTRREFGFIPWPEKPGPPPFLRHRGYSNGEALHRDLASHGHHSVYYSTAYYRRPAEMRMADKQWLGAELIFDLDADHLAEVEKAKAEGGDVPVADQLALVKQQFVRLLDEFLMGDLGLGEDDLWITFSGGRGYHCHVTHPAYMALDNRARREIVDYVTGKVPTERGTDRPDLDVWVERKVVGMDGHGRYAKPVVQERIPPASTSGWPGRITRTFVEQLKDNVVEAPRDEALAWLQSHEDIGPGRAKDFMSKADHAMLERIAKGVMEGGPAGRVVFRRLLRDPGVSLAAKGETDEPVTADVKRLIRLPGSLHGKSGLKVVVLRRDDLAGFEPLRDAVAFHGPPVRILPRFSQEVTLGGEAVRVEEGVEVEVPESHAVWICARQGGTVVA